MQDNMSQIKITDMKIHAWDTQTSHAYHTLAISWLLYGRVQCLILTGLQTTGAIYREYYQWWFICSVFLDIFVSSHEQALLINLPPLKIRRFGKGMKELIKVIAFAIFFWSRREWPKIDQEHQHHSCLLPNWPAWDADVLHFQTLVFFFEEYRMCYSGISEPSKTLICCIEVSKATSKQQNVAFHEQLFLTLKSSSTQAPVIQSTGRESHLSASNTPETVSYNTNKQAKKNFLHKTHCFTNQ